MTKFKTVPVINYAAFPLRNGWSGGIAPIIPYFGTQLRWVVRFTLHPHFHPWRESKVATKQEAGWAPGKIRNLNSSVVYPAALSLYRLSYPGPLSLSVTKKICVPQLPLTVLYRYLHHGLAHVIENQTCLACEVSNCACHTAAVEQRKCGMHELGTNLNASGDADILRSEFDIKSTYATRST